MSVADELRAAATRLEALAAAAKPGPWEQTIDDHGRKGVDHGVWSQGECDRGGYGWVVEYVNPHATDAPDTAWIAALGPQVAAPLVAWLRDTADFRDVVEHGHEQMAAVVARVNWPGPTNVGSNPAVAPATARALAFARLVNGSAS